MKIILAKVVIGTEIADIWTLRNIPEHVTSYLDLYRWGLSQNIPLQSRILDATSNMNFNVLISSLEKDTGRNKDVSVDPSDSWLRRCDNDFYSSPPMLLFKWIPHDPLVEQIRNGNLCDDCVVPESAVLTAVSNSVLVLERETEAACDGVFSSDNQGMEALATGHLDVLAEQVSEDGQQDAQSSQRLLEALQSHDADGSNQTPTENAHLKFENQIDSAAQQDTVINCETSANPVDIISTNFRISTRSYNAEISRFAGSAALYRRCLSEHAAFAEGVRWKVKISEKHYKQAFLDIGDPSVAMDPDNCLILTASVDRAFEESSYVDEGGVATELLCGLTCILFRKAKFLQEALIRFLGCPIQFEGKLFIIVLKHWKRQECSKQFGLISRIDVSPRESLPCIVKPVSVQGSLSIMAKPSSPQDSLQVKFQPINPLGSLSSASLIFGFGQLQYNATVRYSFGCVDLFKELATVCASSQDGSGVAGLSRLSGGAQRRFINWNHKLKQVVYDGSYFRLEDPRMGLNSNNCMVASVEIDELIDSSVLEALDGPAVIAQPHGIFELTGAEGLILFRKAHFLLDTLRSLVGERNIKDGRIYMIYYKQYCRLDAPLANTSAARQAGSTSIGQASGCVQACPPPAITAQGSLGGGGSHVFYNQAEREVGSTKPVGSDEYVAVSAGQVVGFSAAAAAAAPAAAAGESISRSSSNDSLCCRPSSMKMHGMTRSRKSVSFAEADEACYIAVFSDGNDSSCDPVPPQSSGGFSSASSSMQVVEGRCASNSGEAKTLTVTSGAGVKRPASSCLEVTEGLVPEAAEPPAKHPRPSSSTDGSLQDLTGSLDVRGPHLETYEQMEVLESGPRPRDFLEP